MAKKETKEMGRNGKDGPANANRMTAIDDRPPLSKSEKKKALFELQVELVKLQDWVKETGAKVCVVFEGRDTAGKGGTIKRMTARLSPRTFRVVALPTPTERQKSQMYIQRYMEHF